MPDLIEVPLYRLVRTSDIAGWAIRFGTRSRWNHVQIPTDDGRFLGAEPSGLSYEGAGSNGHTVYARITALQYATYLAAARAHIGVGYSWIDILSVGLLQYGIKLGFIRSRVLRTDRLMCSQAVDLCAAAAGLSFFEDGRQPQDVTPGDLANLGALSAGIYLK